MINESMCLHAKSLQSCLTLCDPMGCSLQDSSICGIFQARILELPCPPPGELLNSRIKPESPALQADSLLPSHQGRPIESICVD